jgi:hypothetical protein
MIDPRLRDDEAPGETVATDRTVRQFAVLLGVVLTVAAARDVFGRGAGVRGSTLAAIGLAVAVAGLVRPRTVRPLFTAAVAITRPIGAVISVALLGIIYYVVFTPLAFLFRLVGRDALMRRRRPQASTYWAAKESPADIRSYFRP